MGHFPREQATYSKLDFNWVFTYRNYGVDAKGPRKITPLMGPLPKDSEATSIDPFSQTLMGHDGATLESPDGSAAESSDGSSPASPGFGIGEAIPVRQVRMQLLGRLHPPLKKCPPVSLPSDTRRPWP